MNIALIAIAIVFTLVATIRPFKVFGLKINMATGAIISLAFLFLTKAISASTIIDGIIGNGAVEPWEILIIFFAVAYVSISTDATGIFDFFAYKIVEKSSGNGIKLFLFLFLFVGALTIITSNDIVILTLTPIIFYLGKHAKINVVPLLFLQFFTANALANFLYTSDPTNIIVGNALGIGFWEFTHVMWLPTVAGAIATFSVLLLMFRKTITRKFKLNRTSHYNVRNWTDAVLSFSLLITMLVVLVFSDVLQIPIWVIALVFAIMFICKDALFWFFYSFKEHQLSVVQIQKGIDVHKIPKGRSDFLVAFAKVPWQILPFVALFFILMQALNDAGVVAIAAGWLSEVCTGVWSSVFATGVLGVILANIVNNQPMTIFLSHVLADSAFTVSGKEYTGAMFGLVVTGNLGSNLTIVGALAGLMWRQILKTKGLEISYWDFAKKGFVLVPVVLIITLTALVFVIK
ncbi:MAG: SLC13 family permease [Patescibacteria group bacterium]